MFAGISSFCLYPVHVERCNMRPSPRSLQSLFWLQHLELLKMLTKRSRPQAASSSCTDLPFSEGALVFAGSWGCPALQVE